ncbi:hypothetical protein BD289DRAFT_274548 [Coniella lustricola]|uniref:Uncharacterized protein n=1 Tax=Coniella lustricola TaxID=2025994 RepID=A0A2T3A6X3_9PEZI|nr:hypothetical protein BD289DRAFT_274548 [Coniella lustricola]
MLTPTQSHARDQLSMNELYRQLPGFVVAGPGVKNIYSVLPLSASGLPWCLVFLASTAADTDTEWKCGVCRTSNIYLRTDAASDVRLHPNFHADDSAVPRYGGALLDDECGVGHCWNGRQARSSFLLNSPLPPSLLPAPAHHKSHKAAFIESSFPIQLHN